MYSQYNSYAFDQYAEDAEMSGWLKDLLSPINIGIGKIGQKRNREAQVKIAKLNADAEARKADSALAMMQMQAQRLQQLPPWVLPVVGGGLALGVVALIATKKRGKK